MYKRRSKLEVINLVKKAWEMRQAYDRDPLDKVTAEGANTLEGQVVEFLQTQAASSEADAEIGLEALQPYIFQTPPSTRRGNSKNYDFHRDLFALGLLGKGIDSANSKLLELLLTSKCQARFTKVIKERKDPIISRKIYSLFRDWIDLTRIAELESRGHEERQREYKGRIDLMEAFIRTRNEEGYKEGNRGFGTPPPARVQSPASSRQSSMVKHTTVSFNNEDEEHYHACPIGERKEESPSLSEDDQLRIAIDLSMAEQKQRMSPAQEAEQDQQVLSQAMRDSLDESNLRALFLDDTPTSTHSSTPLTSQSFTDPNLSGPSYVQSQQPAVPPSFDQSPRHSSTLFGSGLTTQSATSRSFHRSNPFK